MVDCVMIDGPYNSEVFNVAMSDTLPRKNSLLAGRYELQALDSKTTIVVKIIGMLGEEVLMTQKV